MTISVKSERAKNHGLLGGGGFSFNVKHSLIHVNFNPIKMLCNKEKVHDIGGAIS